MQATCRRTFRLKITRPGSEYDADIYPSFGYSRSDKRTADWLSQLFDNAAPSGYGDVRAQETKFDVKIRDAREILASEFSVTPELIDTIRQTRAANFYPCEVRVEPYKIHLYGKGGHFDAHRDTPETALVGTFLLGIGDTIGEKNLELGVHKDVGDFSDPVKYPAAPGRWVAFYPDVPHCVTPVSKGHRGVIAFKIFRVDDPEPEPPKVEERVQAVTDNLQAPFGLLLERKYCMSPRHLSGFDAVMYEALTRRADLQLHLLPVVARWSASVYPEDIDGALNKFKAPVYPFTTAHADELVALANSSVTDPAHADPDLSWLKRMGKHVDVFTMDLDSTTVEWSRRQQSVIGYTGNESQPYEEDSVYLSYALVALPSEA
ncbi:hypothetical protein BV25DRAFT_1800507 [Artomyces pyxidatus]|uniref:Uncharacterized protein n=1 Tax=Artomyces pyxidatus TaxID=48021 RepID=A0ACB8T6M8_9AGAM|nr:hypothetical protein BV25DRAFT_1800507 [Artomyces pyxidatus]